MAEEQRALRRVTSLVVRGASPSTVFRTVAGEVGRLLDADYAAIFRFEPGDMICMLSRWHAPDVPDLGVPHFGGRWPIKDDATAVEVYRTGRPLRGEVGVFGGELGGFMRAQGIGHAVSCPVIVDDRVWGLVGMLFRGSRTVPADAEIRMRDFVELSGCTIAQAESRGDLIASRARVVAAFDEARRQWERDLHDGVQQRLISLGLDLRLVEASVPADNEELVRRLSDAVADLADVQSRLQEIAHGLHPTILRQRGLEAAIRSLVRRFPVPAEVNVNIEGRLPEQVELAVYHLVSEALANVLKHANASSIGIDVAVRDETLRIEIQDDGVGGADPHRGSGLIGLVERVEAIAGTMEVSSPEGEGTSLIVEVPLASAARP